VTSAGTASIPLRYDTSGGQAGHHESQDRLPVITPKVGSGANSHSGVAGSTGGSHGGSQGSSDEVQGRDRNEQRSILQLKGLPPPEAMTGHKKFRAMSKEASEADACEGPQKPQEKPVTTSRSKKEAEDTNSVVSDAIAKLEDPAQQRDVPLSPVTPAPLGTMPSTAPGGNSVQVSSHGRVYSVPDSNQ